MPCPPRGGITVMVPTVRSVPVCSPMLRPMLGPNASDDKAGPPVAIPIPPVGLCPARIPWTGDFAAWFASHFHPVVAYHDYGDSVLYARDR